jgi:hypothetical protein
MEIHIRHANPESDATHISKLINIYREERRTILNSFNPQKEAEYLKGLPESDAVLWRLLMACSRVSLECHVNGLTLTVQGTVLRSVHG